MQTNTSLEAKQGDYTSPTHALDFLDLKLLNCILITIPCSFLTLLDLFANVVNIRVFVDQGLNSSIEISFFTIALTDLVRVVFVPFELFCISSYVDESALSVKLIEFYYVVITWPMNCVIRTSLHVTVYTTLERCFCVLFPLQIKSIITKKTTTVVIGCIVAVNGLTLYPIYSTIYLSWNVYPKINRTLLGLGFLKDKTEPLRINYVLHIVLTVLPLGLLVILTSLLVSHLYANRKWRLQNSATAQARKASLSSRDIKSIRLVTVVAALVVSCYLPVVTIVLACFFIPDLNFNGKYDTVIPYLFAMVIVSLSMSSIVSTSIYFKMSTNYKNAFMRLFYPPTAAKVIASQR
ncbi:FMRFamide receptor [Biomphalaria glabrata]|nr:FMRFamide receptor-like [Biomphalaria glabrata]